MIDISKIKMSTAGVIKPENEDQARQLIVHVVEAGSVRALARQADKPESTVRHWVHAARRILNIDKDRRLEDYIEDIPEGHKLKGVSTLYDSAGKERLKWVKTSADLDRQKEIVLAVAEGLKSEIGRELEIAPPYSVEEDLLSCYVVTDYHMGQMSWLGETGEAWDIDIAEAVLMGWFERAIKTTPNSRVGVLAQLGDFLHYDSLLAVTPSSGHVLDADVRYFELVPAVIRVLRAVINLMLEKHDHVHVILAEGNHDLASSVWLRALFAEKYEDNERVTVNNSNTPYYAYEWGKTSLYFHHGHKKRVKDISKTFAGMYSSIFGRTLYRYAHTGHLHHVEVKEDQLMIVEQHSTLAAKDAHATRGGYLSQRGASVITYCRKHGEVSRTTIRPEIAL